MVKQSVLSRSDAIRDMLGVGISPNKMVDPNIRSDRDPYVNRIHFMAS